jgi:hypothetical protein
LSESLAKQVEPSHSDEYIGELKKLKGRNPHDHDTLETLVSVEGIVTADWTDIADFADGLS